MSSKEPKPSKYIIKLYKLKGFNNKPYIAIGTSLEEAKKLIWDQINSLGFNTENYKSLATWVLLNTQLCSMPWKIEIQYQWDSYEDQLEFFLT